MRSESSTARTWSSRAAREESWRHSRSSASSSSSSSSSSRSTSSSTQAGSRSSLLSVLTGRWASRATSVLRRGRGAGGEGEAGRGGGRRARRSGVDEQGRVAGLGQEREAHHPRGVGDEPADRKSTRLNSSHSQISYAVFFF